MIGRTILAVVFTALPVGALLRYFYHRDAHPEPRSVVLRTFVLGIVCIAPLYPIGLLIASLTPMTVGPWWVAAYQAFILAAVPEEFFKFAVLRGYSARQPAFNEPMDGMVYGAAAALGFAAFENALYIWKGGWGVAITRAVTSVPLHAATGAVLGFFVSQAIFHQRGRRALWIGFSWAVLIHGVYDFGLMAAIEVLTHGVEQGIEPGGAIGLLVLLSLGTLVASVLWTVRAVRRLRKDQLANERLSW